MCRIIAKEIIIKEEAYSALVIFVTETDGFERAYSSIDPAKKIAGIV